MSGPNPKSVVHLEGPSAQAASKNRIRQQAPLARRYDDVMSLQQTYGNAAVSALLARRQVVVQKLHLAVKRGIAEAEDGRWVQEDQLEKQRGVTGLVSDWWSDAVPPHIGEWHNAKQLFLRADSLLQSDDLRGAFIYTVNGVKALDEAKHGWSKFMNQSIEGAGGNIAALEVVHDLAFTAEVALLTGGIAAGALGGGALGAAGGTLIGATAAVSYVAESDGAVGVAVRGTLGETLHRGAAGNLRLAANAALGIAYGIGEALSQMPEALVGVIRWLESAIKDPSRLADDRDRFVHFVRTLRTTMAEQWNVLSALPEDKQAFLIGRLAGQVEASLIALEVGGKMGGGLGEMIEDAAQGGGLALETGGEIAGELVQIQAMLERLGKAGSAITVVAAVSQTKPDTKPDLGPERTRTMPQTQSPVEGTGGKAPPPKRPTKKRLTELAVTANAVERRFWKKARHDPLADDFDRKRRKIDGLIKAQRAEEAAAEIKRYEAAMEDAAERQAEAGLSWNRQASGDEAVASGLTKNGLPLHIESIEQLRRLPRTLPEASAFPAERLKVLRAPLRNAHALLAQRQILSAIEEARLLSTDGGRLYEKLIKKYPEALSGAAMSKNAVRSGRVPDQGLIEITIEGRERGFSLHKRQQLWLDLVDMRTIILVVPKLCAEAADELRQLAAGARALGIDVEVTVIETLP